MNGKPLQSVKVFAPASVANVGCGFDVLAFAINGPGDVVEISRKETPGVVIESITGDNGKLPLIPIENTAGRAVLALIDELEHSPDFGMKIRIEKRMPLGSGLGSSAASAAGAAVAANAILGNPFSRKELLQFALEGELAASGSPHGDNISASLLGGFVLVRSHQPLDVIELNVPKELVVTVLHPHIEMKTKNTRLILRRSVQLSKAVTQWGNVGGLIAGLYREDYDLIGRSLHDEIVEPARAILIPGFDEMKETAMKTGALGFSISGAGSSVFALSRSTETAENIGKALGKVMDTYNLGFDIHISEINTQGCHILEQTEVST